jgi:hypothetical protein
MAAMEKNSAQSRVESGSATQCGCQAFPETPAVFSIAPAQREFRDVALVDNAFDSFAPIAMFRTEDGYTPPGPESSRRSQSVLCIFLI